MEPSSFHGPCKLGMIPRERNGQKLTLAERLSLAGEAGLDGVDLDQAAEFTPGPADEIAERCRAEIKKLLPLAASLGQPILIENV